MFLSYIVKLKILVLNSLVLPLFCLTIINPICFAFQPSHPMDALTPSEVDKAIGLLQNAGMVDKSTRYPMINLHEMPKSSVWSWKAGDFFSRSAFIVYRKNQRTFEAIVDLTGNKVSWHREVPGVQPNIMQEEWDLAAKITKDDKRWQKAMLKRGYSKFDDIFCAPMMAGRLYNDGFNGRRILRVVCYDNSGKQQHSTHSHGQNGQPIEGVMAVVDTDKKEVINIDDSGVVSMNDIDHNQLHQHSNNIEKIDTEQKSSELEQELSPYKPEMKPVRIISPNGHNYRIKGGIEIEWQNWTFHVRMNRRVGPVLSLLRYNDNGTLRKIAYQVYMSEMFVPYMSSDPHWSFRTLLDAGEFGLGYLASSLSVGRDCPSNATYINITIPSDLGGMFQVERAMCVFERNTGNPNWRHAEPGANDANSRADVELVVRGIPTLGNYDYIIDYIFTLDGKFKVRAGASGILAVKGVKSAHMHSPTAKEDTEHGTLVAPYTVAINHDHFFSIRMDLDIDGKNNAIERGYIKQKILPDNPRRSLWQVEPEIVKNEGAIDTSLIQENSIIKVINPNKETSLGHNPGFDIIATNSEKSILIKKDLPQQRAAYSGERIWVSKYKYGELFAAGRYPNLSLGGDGIGRFVKDKDNINNDDLVLWLTLGFHHIPRVEEWPIMSTHWLEVTLRPSGFMTSNPASDLAPYFAKEVNN